MPSTLPEKPLENSWGGCDGSEGRADSGVRRAPGATPGGKRAASQLRQLIDLKDTAHYGFINISAPQLKRSLRQAQHLVEFAEGVLRR